jgi:hypothetical protein
MFKNRPKPNFVDVHLMESGTRINRLTDDDSQGRSKKVE